MNQGRGFEQMFTNPGCRSSLACADSGFVGGFPL
jgi:hypothetical protein